MKASVTYTRLGSSSVQEEAKTINKWIEDNGYQFYANWYANEEISRDADKFVKEAVSKLDGSMKGWSPANNGTETHYQIHHTKDGIEFSYTRHYTK